MPKARPVSGSGDSAYDAGTLWRMTRNGWIARCALWSLGDRWELRVTVDAELLFSASRPTVAALFDVAADWRDRMLHGGWTKITPAARPPAAVA